jgi:biotin carboxyl carrier protein
LIVKNDPFRLAVNGQYEFQILPDDLKLLDVIDDENGRFHILRDGRAYRAEVLAMDPSALTYTLRIDGHKFTVRIHDYYERLVQELGLQVGGHHKENIVKAPMPGLVLNVLAAPGQAVQKGDALLILEAMKMENVIKAPADGVVKVVPVQKGQAVEKGALLVEME